MRALAISSRVLHYIMSASQFYIHLPSDSSLNVYPNNTIAKFSTKLANTVVLDGQYEVGLSEIIYPIDYANIDNRDKSYKFWIKRVVKIVDPETQKESFVEEIRKKRLVKTGNYSTIDEFLDSFNHLIADEFSENNLQNNLRFTKGEDDQLILICNRPRDRSSMDGAFFMMSPHLSERLGYDSEATSISLFETYRLRSRNFELNMGKNIMYIYCDVISHSLVGDVSAPLLRACNLQQSAKSRTFHLSFPDVHYKPVQKCQFDTIDISINTEQGNPMPFQSGKVLITLHFRRINSLPLR